MNLFAEVKTATTVEGDGFLHDLSFILIFKLQM